MKIPTPSYSTPTGFPPPGTKVIVVEEIAVDDNGIPLPNQRPDRWVIKTATVPSTELGRFTSAQEAFAFAIFKGLVP